MTHEAKRAVITGVSTGFGRLLAQAMLDRGDLVVGTVRQGSQVAEFEALAPNRAKAILLDVTDRNRIPAAVAEAKTFLGGLDILVNNAGYGQMGALEEQGEDQIDRVIETNLMGTIFMIRAALPALRESAAAGQRPMIVNFSSMAGLVGIAGVSTYCAAKHGVEGLSESLSHELEPLGISVMAIEPGSFRTDFSVRSAQPPSTANTAYDGMFAAYARGVREHGGTERGDPAKAIAAILKAMDAEISPMRLMLGPDTVEWYTSKQARHREEMDTWMATTLSTDFENSAFQNG